ncbi:hypothetical protein HHI36_017241, partial [Cryptolaemus montrouzieri]
LKVQIDDLKTISKTLGNPKGIIHLEQEGVRVFYANDASRFILDKKLPHKRYNNTSQIIKIRNEDDLNERVTFFKKVNSQTQITPNMRKGSNITQKSPINEKHPKKAQQNQFKISILHQNVQSIGNAIDQLQSVIRDVPKENELNVICVTEHWKTKDQLKNYGIEGFGLASYCC